MKQWRFTIKRTELGEVTVTADTEEQARIKARDYGSRIILVDNMSWASQQFVKENLIEVIEGGE